MMSIYVSNIWCVSNYYQIEEKVISEDDIPSRSFLWKKARQNKSGEYSDDDVKEKVAQLVRQNLLKFRLR